MKTPRNLQEYFAKQDSEMEQLKKLKQQIELLEQVRKLEKLAIGLTLVAEAVHGKKNPFERK
jgi:hypothetical protein